jgi:hypothetical protein
MRVIGGYPQCISKQEFFGSDQRIARHALYRFRGNYGAATSALRIERAAAGNRR